MNESACSSQKEKKKRVVTVTLEFLFQAPSKLISGHHTEGIFCLLASELLVFLRQALGFALHLPKTLDLVFYPIDLGSFTRSRLLDLDLPVPPDICKSICIVHFHASTLSFSSPSNVNQIIITHLFPKFILGKVICIRLLRENLKFTRMNPLSKGARGSWGMQKTKG